MTLYMTLLYMTLLYMTLLYMTLLYMTLDNLLAESAVCVGSIPRVILLCVKLISRKPENYIFSTIWWWRQVGAPAHINSLVYGERRHTKLKQGLAVAIVLHNHPGLDHTQRAPHGRWHGLHWTSWPAGWCRQARPSPPCDTSLAPHS